MRTIELKVVAYNGKDESQVVERVNIMGELVYNILFVNRWVEFLTRYESIKDLDGLKPEAFEATNSPHDYDAWDFYRQEFTQPELDYISDKLMPEGDNDWGCGSVIKILIIDNGEERVLYDYK